MFKTLRTLGTAAVLACAVASSQILVASKSDNKEVAQTLTGCVAQGESRGTYLVSVLMVDGAPASSAFVTMAPLPAAPAASGGRNILYGTGQPVFVTSAPSNHFYKLNTTKGLKKEVGHVVEINGTAKLGDQSHGALKVESENGADARTSITAKGRTVKVRDNVLQLPLPDSKSNTQSDIPVYEFKVASMKRLDGDCRTWTANALASVR
jgi:hypothetical protein